MHADAPRIGLKFLSTISNSCGILVREVSLVKLCENSGDCNISCAHLQLGLENGMSASSFELLDLVREKEMLSLLLLALYYIHMLPHKVCTLLSVLTTLLQGCLLVGMVLVAEEAEIPCLLAALVFH